MASDNESVHSNDNEEGEILNLDGLELVDANEDDKEQLMTVLQWIGFEDDFDREKVSGELAETLDDLKDMSVKEMEDGILSLMKAKQAADRVAISAKIRKKLASLVHWVQDFYRCSQKPSLDDVDSPAKLIKLLEVASETCYHSVAQEQTLVDR